MSKLHLQLTDSISRTTSAFPTTPSISHHGNKAYMVYQTGEYNVNNIIAEMFNIQNGTLTSTGVLHPDIINANNFSADDGYANKSFTKFSMVDDDQGGISVGPTGTIRVRIFDSNFNVLASRFNISFAVGTTQQTYSVLGGSFSDDENIYK